MSSLGLSQEELKAVEQTRQRLSQLSASLNSLMNDAFVSNPLPSVDSLEASADILNHNVRAILEITTQNNELFSRVTIHPSTNFPGRTQEHLLLQLLRKKPDPEVETAMEAGSKTLASMPFPGRAPSTTAGTQDQEKESALAAIWDDVRQGCQRRIGEYVMNEESDSFTAEEHEMGIENVRTGLQRSFEDEYEDDDEDMDMDEVNGAPNRGHTDPDLMIIDRPPPPPAPAVSTQEVEGATLESIMRIATRSQLTA
ncbi:mediator of RNA polymerase II transcription complex subunit 8-domain-containing protein [Nemania diffusa]|nr:mediator of RNA polymerase II transcription complex subunit 8-domain-containing protein [Nemania diffusa]